MAMGMAMRFLLLLPLLLVALQMGPAPVVLVRASAAARKVGSGEENSAAAAGAAAEASSLLESAAVLVVQPRRRPRAAAVTSARYRMAKAPRREPSGPSPTHNGVGTTGTTGRVAVRRMTMQRRVEEHPEMSSGRMQLKIGIGNKLRFKFKQA